MRARHSIRRAPSRRHDDLPFVWILLSDKHKSMMTLPGQVVGTALCTKINKRWAIFGNHAAGLITDHAGVYSSDLMGQDVATAHNAQVRED
jgi:hypothetical protein